jgi:hypothetical protein
LSRSRTKARSQAAHLVRMQIPSLPSREIRRGSGTLPRERHKVVPFRTLGRSATLPSAQTVASFSPPRSMAPPGCGRQRLRSLPARLFSTERRSRSGRSVPMAAFTAAADGAARIWDPADGREIAKPLHHGDDVLFARVSPDGRRILTASRDKTARLWNPETAEPIGRPMVHDHEVTSPVFWPTGVSS